jgi:hypothetical protein
MRAELLEADSLAFGRSVLAIHEFSKEADFRVFEATYVRKHEPVYVSCRVPVEDVAAVHLLEEQGFRFVECQIRSTIRLTRPFDTHLYPYAFERVTSQESGAEVLDIAGRTFVHDRLSVDPLVGPKISGERYRQYVLKSFRSKDEAVYRLVEPKTRKTLAFKTHRYVGDSEVLFLLGGVHPDYKAVGLGAVSEYFEFNELIRKGIRRGTTHISAANYPVFNLEIGRLGFRVAEVYAVLRKLYPVVGNARG